MLCWEGLPRHEATWESYEEMQQLCPDLHLENKVNLETGSNDRPPIILQYSRSGKRSTAGVSSLAVNELQVIS